MKFFLRFQEDRSSSSWARSAAKRNEQSKDAPAVGPIGCRCIGCRPPDLV